MDTRFPRPGGPPAAVSSWQVPTPGDEPGPSRAQGQPEAGAWLPRRQDPAPAASSRPRTALPETPDQTLSAWQRSGVLAQRLTDAGLRTLPNDAVNANLGTVAALLQVRDGHPPSGAVPPGPVYAELAWREDALGAALQQGIAVHAEPALLRPLAERVFGAGQVPPLVIMRPGQGDRAEFVEALLGPQQIDPATVPDHAQVLFDRAGRLEVVANRGPGPWREVLPLLQQPGLDPRLADQALIDAFVTLVRPAAPAAAEMAELHRFAGWLRSEAECGRPTLAGFIRQSQRHWALLPTNAHVVAYLDKALADGPLVGDVVNVLRAMAQGSTDRPPLHPEDRAFLHRHRQMLDRGLLTSQNKEQDAVEQFARWLRGPANPSRLSLNALVVEIAGGGVRARFNEVVKAYQQEPGSAGTERSRMISGLLDRFTNFDAIGDAALTRSFERNYQGTANTATIYRRALDALERWLLAQGRPSLAQLRRMVRPGTASSNEHLSAYRTAPGVGGSAGVRAVRAFEHLLRTPIDGDPPRG